LLYCEGFFIQILEGEKKTIGGLFNKITQDARHKDIRVITNGSSPKRYFPQWTMGFNYIEKKELLTLEEINYSSVKDFLYNSNPYKLMKLLSLNHWN
jgi:hypothetical protein